MTRVIPAAKVRAIDVAGRTPPHDADAERAVLAAVLTEPGVMDVVAAVLPTGDVFYIDAHRRIYDAALGLHRAGGVVDMQTVASALKAADRLQAIGGLAFLSTLVDATPAVAHVEAHARIVADLARVRRGIEAAHVIAAEGYTDHGDAQAYLDRAAASIETIAHHGSGRAEAVQAYDLAHDALRRYESTAARGVPTGIGALDRAIGGLRGGELVCIAGRPAMGKTSLATCIASNLVRAPSLGEDGTATRHGALVFSLEMPKEQMAARLICAEGGTDVGRYFRQQYQAPEYDRFVEASHAVGMWPLWVDDTASITLAEVRAKARACRAKYERAGQRLGCIVVDHLGLMGDAAGHGRNDNREQRVAENARGLKALAKDLDVPVVMLAQLNREVEKRGDKRPQLSDLRESGSIEQDCDVVLLVFREEYYVEDKDSAKARAVKGQAEAIVAKQRNGPTVTVPLAFRDHCCRFEDRA